MILVTLGTQKQSFTRLLDMVENSKIKDEIIVQAGHTKYESKNMKILDLIPPAEFEKYQNEANLIITHGGVGSIVSSVKKGKRVIAVPRLHKYGEHVNDHQIEIVERFNKNRCIIGVNGVEELKQAIIDSKDFVPNKFEGNNEKMLKIIEDFIDKI